MASTEELQLDRPMRSTNPYLGVGLYTMADAARLIEVPRQKLRRWREGYTFGKVGIRKPLLGEDHPELARHQILTLADLVELKLISLFRNAGVSMREIRKVAERAAVPDLHRPRRRPHGRRLPPVRAGPLGARPRDAARRGALRGTRRRSGRPGARARRAWRRCRRPVRRGCRRARHADRCRGCAAPSPIGPRPVDPDQGPCPAGALTG